MVHIFNYIIQITNELNETFKTESGISLYGHKDFNYARMSNRYATIIGQPLDFEGEILELGTKVLIDPSVYYHSTHGEDNVKQYTTNTIDQQKGFYAIEPQNIVLYKKDDTWHGYLDNFLGKNIVEKTDDKILGGIIMEVGKKKNTNDYSVVCLNEFLKENEITTGDILFMKPNYGVSVWLDGKEHTWLRSGEVMAKKEVYGKEK